MAFRQEDDLSCRKLSAQRVRFKYGVRRRAFTVPQTKRDIATAGTVLETFITLPKKAWLLGGGFQSAASDIVLATTDGFKVVTADGTVLGTSMSAADYTLGSGRATTIPFELGTFVATNKPMAIRIHATGPGVRGSVYFFVDYQTSDKTGGAL